MRSPLATLLLLASFGFGLVSGITGTGGTCWGGDDETSSHERDAAMELKKALGGLDIEELTQSLSSQMTLDEDQTHAVHEAIREFAKSLRKLDKADEDAMNGSFEKLQATLNEIARGANGDHGSVGSEGDRHAETLRGDEMLRAHDHEDDEHHHPDGDHGDEGQHGINANNWIKDKGDGNYEINIDFDEETAEAIAEAVEEWADRFAEHMEDHADEIEDFFESFGERMEEWTDEFARGVEKWAEEHEGEMEAWGEEFAARWEEWAQTLSDPEAKEHVHEIVRENMKMLSEMPILEHFDELMEDTPSLQELPWDNLDEAEDIVRKSVEGSVRALEEMSEEISEEEIELHERTLGEVSEALERLRDVQVRKRANLENEALRQYELANEQLRKHQQRYEEHVAEMTAREREARARQIERAKELFEREKEKQQRAMQALHRAKARSLRARRERQSGDHEWTADEEEEAGEDEEVSDLAQALIEKIRELDRQGDRSALIEAFYDEVTAERASINREKSEMEQLRDEIMLLRREVQKIRDKK